jgi:chaperonin cofactor prefoldin
VGQVFFGNLNYYASPDEAVREVSTENTLLKEKIALLEEQNRLLHNLLERMNVKLIKVTTIL